MSEYKKIDEFTASILLTDGRETIVDLQDAEKLSKYIWSPLETTGGHVRPVRNMYVGFGNGHCGRNKSYKKRYIYHDILNVDSMILNKRDVDHIDRNTLNNRRSNLRIVTRQVNSLNGSKHLDAVGVDFHKDSGLWRARFREKSLGYRKTREEALALVKEARDKVIQQVAVPTEPIIVNAIIVSDEDL
jgi:hypothetical protein